MCVIIDTNRLGDFFKRDKNNGMELVRDWVDKKNGRLVYGTTGRWATEVIGQNRELLKGYYQAGKAIEVEEKAINLELGQLVNVNEHIRSDDPHILATALASKARLLCTNDDDLIRDFKNKDIINDPPGKIYSSSKHRHLLTKSNCVPKRKSDLC